jgi:ferritin heavy chain
VCLKGFKEFFLRASDTLWSQAEEFLLYQNRRGGDFRLDALMNPLQPTDGGPLELMKRAYRLEQSLYGNLTKIWESGRRHADPDVCSWVEYNYVGEQLKTMERLAGYITLLSEHEPVCVVLMDQQFMMKFHRDL